MYELDRTAHDKRDNFISFSSPEDIQVFHALPNWVSNFNCTKMLMKWDSKYIHANISQTSISFIFHMNVKMPKCLAF